MIRCLTVLLCGALACSAGRAADQVPPAISPFLLPVEFRNPKLSPDGQRLGVTGTREFADYFAVIDVKTMQLLPGINFTDVQLINYWWKGNDRVLLLIEGLDGTRAFRSFDLQTKKMQALHTFNNGAGSIVNPLAGNPQHVLVSTTTSTGVDLRQLNVRSGKMTVLERNPGFVLSWLTDREGRAVAGFGLLDGEWFLLTRSAPGAEWRRQSLGKRVRPDFWPTAVARDQRRPLGWEQLATDTTRVVARDPATAADEILFHDPRVDPSANVFWSDDYTHARGVVFETDRERVRYFDPADARLAQQIDASLPDTTNTVISTSADESRLVVEASSSTRPLHYFLLDRTVPRLVSLGAARAFPAGLRFAPSEYFEFNARDGVKLSGRIHRPADAAAATPLIVLCGPAFNRRSFEGFKPATQLIALRGYAVMEVNHRGWPMPRAKRWRADGPRQDASRSGATAKAACWRCMPWPEIRKLSPSG